MFNKLSNRIYYMDFVEKGDRPILALVIGDDYSLVIDGGNSKAHGEEFLSHVSRLGIKPTYLLLTHWHWDHVWGMDAMNLINVANVKTKAKLEWLRTLDFDDKSIRKRVLNGEEIEFCEEHIKIEHPNKDRKLIVPKIHITFENKIEFDLGGIKILMENIDTDHSEDCSIITARSDDEVITFMGDAMYMDMYSGPWSYNKDKLYSFLNKLLDYNADYYIPSHHGLYKNNEFKDFVSYIMKLGDTVNDSTNLEEVIEVMEWKVGRQLTESEVEDLKAFIEGNKKIEQASK